MELKEKSNCSSSLYPKETNDRYRIYHHPKTNSFSFLKNPLINNFTHNSFFIFDQIDSIRLFRSLTNKNSIKISTYELDYLKSINSDIKFQKYINNNENFIQIDKDLYTKMNDFLM